MVSFFASFDLSGGEYTLSRQKLQELVEPCEKIGYGLRGSERGNPTASCFAHWPRSCCANEALYSATRVTNATRIRCEMEAR